MLRAGAARRRVRFSGRSIASFGSAPVIVGTPTVGVATAYTTGVVGGNPPPLITQHWTLDGVDIVGATAATYTPVAGDSTHALRVREVATNSIGQASSTSAPKTVS